MTKLRNVSGFTLIEILLGMAIILIIASGSYVGFTRFSRQQNLNIARDTLLNSLNEARSNAASQVIRTSVCKNSSQTLIGHQLNFHTTFYDLEEVCQNGSTTSTPLIKRILLSSGITFNPNPAPIRFLILTGGISGGVNRTATLINTAGQARNISVNASGVISSN